MSVSPHPNDPHGFTPQCAACDDRGCDLCCPTSPVTLEDLNDMPFPTDHPHVHANRLEAQEPDDKGACYLERITVDTIIVTVRSPREKHESKVSIPFIIWLQMIADHRRPGSVNGEMLAALKSAYGLYRFGAIPHAFANGVTDSTGTIDEGEVYASGVMDEVAAAIRKAEATLASESELVAAREDKAFALGVRACLNRLYAAGARRDEHYQAWEDCEAMERNRVLSLSAGERP